MNIDIKLLIKYKQTEFKNTLKRSFTIMSKWDLFQGSAYQHGTPH